MGLISLIVQILKALPTIERLFNQVVEAYFSTIELKEEKKVTKINTKRSEIISRLKSKDLSDEERTKLRKDLYSLTRH
jgi:hypothetical protein